MIKLYDKVILKDGRTGFVVFCLDDTHFIVEITDSHETVTVSDRDIMKVSEKVKE